MMYSPAESVAPPTEASNSRVTCMVFTICAEAVPTMVATHTAAANILFFIFSFLFPVGV
jgi:hypothetical protein